MGVAKRVLAIQLDNQTTTTTTNINTIIRFTLVAGWYYLLF
jgi:hypothetical protein